MTENTQIDLVRGMDRMMRAIHAYVHEKGSKIDVDKIGPIGGMTLLALEDIEPAPMSDLVANLRRDKSQMTRIVRQLESVNAIEVRPSETDGRVKLLSLTKKGRLMTGDQRKFMAEALVEVLGPIDPEEQRVLERVLSRVQRAI